MVLHVYWTIQCSGGIRLDNDPFFSLKGKKIAGDYKQLISRRYISTEMFFVITLVFVLRNNGRSTYIILGLIMHSKTIINNIFKRKEGCMHWDFYALFGWFCFEFFFLPDKGILVPQCSEYLGWFYYKWINKLG